jgi:hypothetical protein
MQITIDLPDNLSLTESDLRREVAIALFQQNILLTIPFSKSASKIATFKKAKVQAIESFINCETTSAFCLSRSIPNPMKLLSQKREIREIIDRFNEPTETPDPGD